MSETYFQMVQKTYYTHTSLKKKKANIQNVYK